MSRQRFQKNQPGTGDVGIEPNPAAILRVANRSGIDRDQEKLKMESKKNGPLRPVFILGRGGGIRTHDPLPPRHEF
jgi:hypothetical protein